MTTPTPPPPPPPPPSPRAGEPSSREHCDDAQRLGDATQHGDAPRRDIAPRRDDLPRDDELLLDLRAELAAEPTTGESNGELERELELALARGVSDASAHGDEIDLALDLALDLDWEADDDASHAPPAIGPAPTSATEAPVPEAPVPEALEAFEANRTHESAARAKPADEPAVARAGQAAIEIGIDDTELGVASARAPGAAPTTAARATGGAATDGQAPGPRFSGSSLDFGRLSLDDEPARRERPATGAPTPGPVDASTRIVAIAAAAMLVAAALVLAFGDRLA